MESRGEEYDRHIIFITQKPERKPAWRVLESSSSLLAWCPFLYCSRVGNGSDLDPGDLRLNQTVQYVPTQALSPRSKQGTELEADT
ncbi:hypothetical protein SRHO_G00044370 [Serrasalmus rhombeus]